MLLQRPTLVLNASYEPVNIVSARRAIGLVIKGAAHVESASPYSIRTEKLVFRLPSVVRLLVYRRVPHQNRTASRRGIMLRDRHICQYCGRSFEARKLTLDHVIPRSRGGGSTWENLVACCLTCNNRKADRTPLEAGMTLAKRPAQLGVHSRYRLTVGLAEPAWEPYLFC